MLKTRRGNPADLGTALSTGSNAKAVSQNHIPFLVALSSTLREQLVEEDGGLREALVCDVNRL